MKICGRCGAKNGDNNKFCMECGSPLGVQNNNSFQYGNDQGNGMNRGPSGNRNTGEEVIYTNVAPRSIAMSVILSIVTCGIYFLYWMYHLNNEINELAQDETAPSGGLVIVLTIVTCGIYSFYWYYKMGEKCDYIAQVHNSSNIVFLLLGIFGLGIVSAALMQDTINKVLE